jgi:hypothetical protein
VFFPAFGKRTPIQATRGFRTFCGRRSTFGCPAFHIGIAIIERVATVGVVQW